MLCLLTLPSPHSSCCLPHSLPLCKTLTMHSNNLTLYACKFMDVYMHADAGAYLLLLSTLQCLSVAIEEKDRGTEGRMYCNMGNCLRAVIELEKAKECYDRVSNNTGMYRSIPPPPHATTSTLHCRLCTICGYSYVSYTLFR